VPQELAIAREHDAALVLRDAPDIGVGEEIARRHVRWSVAGRR